MPEQIWFCVYPSENPHFCILNSKGRDTIYFFFSTTRITNCVAAPLLSHDAICSSQCETAKHWHLPPPLGFQGRALATRDQAAWLICLQKDGGCLLQICQSPWSKWMKGNIEDRELFISWQQSCCLFLLSTWWGDGDKKLVCRGLNKH